MNNQEPTDNAKDPVPLVTTQAAWDVLFGGIYEHSCHESPDRALLIRAAEALARLLREGGPIPDIDRC